jgi:tetratricopeptide (TPR) repeat protein
MVSSGELLGRDQELATLNAVVAAAADQGAALLVLGDPGIGKSALLMAARATALDAGYTVLLAAGVASEMHLPFGSIQQLLTPLLKHLTSLPDAQRDAVTSALGLSDGANPDLFLIAEAAFGMLSRARAERPVVIVVDDVHWLDAQSHRILAFLAHRGIGAGICVVGATRTGHSGPLVDAGFPELRVEGVDDAAAEVILRRHGEGMGAVHLNRIRLEAQGNPLALLELPYSWRDGPPSEAHPLAVSAKLERAFAGRISELPAGTRDALLVAAVGSSSDSDEILRGVSALGACRSSGDVLAPAVAAGLISNERSQIAFRHPLVRSGVLQRETLTRRHAAHAALAAVVTSDRFRSTWHRAWSIVGPDDDVADALTAMVPDCLRRGAVLAAVSSFERAAHLTSSSVQRGHRLLQGADLAFEAGRADIVGRLLREAAQVDLSDLDVAHVTWLTEALNGDVRADSALVRQLCASARRAADLGDEDLALNLLHGAALRCWWADSGAADRSAVVETLDAMTNRSGDPRELATLALAEPVLRGSEVLRSLRSLPLDQLRDGVALKVYGIAAYGAGDLVLATDLLDRAEALFRTEGRLGMLPVVLALQLHIRLDLGDWSGAVAAGKEVVTVSRETGQAVFAENHVLVEARGMALRGDWQSALDTMAPAEVDAARAGVNDRICLGYQARGAALLSAGRPTQAFACLQRQYDPSDPGYHLRESFAGVALMAEAAVACGRLAEARFITRGLETVAVITPSPLLQVNLLYAKAVLAPEEAREQRYRDALAHDLTRWPWPRARLHLAHGQWLASTGRHATAAAQLHAALAVFQRIGAARWERSARLSLASLDGSVGGTAGPQQEGGL